MKVLFVSGEFPPLRGGVADYTLILSRELAKRGVEVAILTSTHGARGPEEIMVFPVVERWGWSLWRKARECIHREHPDILHIQYQTAAYGMHPAINFLPLELHLVGTRPKLVATFHDLRLPYLLPKAGPLRRWVTSALARWCDAAIATNEEDLLELRAQGLGEKARLIPIGSNIPLDPPPGYNREERRALWGMGPGDILLSYFGLLNRSKGADTLLRALARVVKEGERNVALLMIGEKAGASDPTNMAYGEEVESLVRELGLGERVFWTGYISAQEVSADLLASDICVLPYRDGVSLRRGSLMAALTHGRPIISTYPSTLDLRLVDGENISLVAPDDPPALSQRIAELAGRPERRRGLGEGAMRLASDFDWHRIAYQTLELYYQLLHPA